jgi:hypothetical protein
MASDASDVSITFIEWKSGLSDDVSMRLAHPHTQTLS